MNLPKEDPWRKFCVADFYIFCYIISACVTVLDWYLNNSFLFKQAISIFSPSEFHKVYPEA